MKKYSVTGMSCAACVARVEQSVSKIPGVESCAVSLLTNSMGIEGDVSDALIIEAVEKAGYQASVKKNDNGVNAISDPNAIEGQNATAAHNATTAHNTTPDLDEITDAQVKQMKKRLGYSVVILLVLMYFAMGHNMAGFPIPKFMEENLVALGILQLILAAIVMVINQRFFVSGFKSAIHLAPNMDTLVAMGSMVSFVYSVAVLFLMTQVQITEGVQGAWKYKNSLYFETAAMILTLITVGKTLEAYSKGKTTDALKSLMKLTPKTACVVQNGTEVVVPVDRVKVGDVFVVRPGESIPVDGIVLEGDSAVNEAALTGESIPVDKSKDDTVSAATINQSGFLKCQATRVGGDTTLAQIIEMVSDAAATKAPIAKMADKVAGIFVPVVLIIETITFAIWILLGESVGSALSFAIAVLVISCPCSLGLATPVAIMVGNGMGAKNGILFKTAASLEASGRIQIVALDKTGTITKGEPKVVDIITNTENDILTVAYALESKSEHPLAKAIVEMAHEKGITKLEVSNFNAIPGKGLEAELDGDRIYGGNREFISSHATISEQLSRQADKLAAEGKTPLYFAKNDKLLGIIAVADVIKEDSIEAIRQLKNMGIHVVMLTGDNERTATAIGNLVGVDSVVSGVLPQGKEAEIRRLQEFGKVAMVGDGINDAPALTRADIGIAIGSGTDVAMDAADVVLVKNQLKDVPAAIRLGRATLKCIRENLFWAFAYNSVGIPVAAGAFVGIFGWRLNPMLGAAAMSMSSICVVSNALRLNLFDIFNSSRDKMLGKIVVEDKTENIDVNNIMEEKVMTKTMKIEGMMCPHCEARVKGVLEAIDGVKEAAVSHSAGTAVLTLEAEVSDDVLKTTVENEKYTVTGIE